MSTVYGLFSGVKVSCSRSSFPLQCPKIYFLREFSQATSFNSRLWRERGNKKDRKRTADKIKVSLLNNIMKDVSRFAIWEKIFHSSYLSIWDESFTGVLTPYSGSRVLFWIILISFHNFWSHDFHIVIHGTLLRMWVNNFFHLFPVVAQFPKKKKNEFSEKQW